MVNGLSCLDLQDQGTQARLQPALLTLRQAVCQYGEFGEVSQSQASSQWAKLQHMLQGLEAGRPSQPPQETNRHLCALPQRDEHGERGKHWSTVGGVYEPVSSIKSLRQVQRAERAYLLRCDRCSKDLLSQWVFVNGGKLRILRPQNGHLGGCGGKYLSVEGLPCVSDNKGQVDMCLHSKIRKDCVLCGGRATCQHRTRRRMCRICRESGLVRRHPRGNASATLL